MVLADAFTDLVVLGIVFGLYFLPTIIAVARGVSSVWSIVVINAFLGWTLVGWVIALAMAVRSVPPAAMIGAPAHASDSTQPAVRGCPNCKQPMRRDAGSCPHCGSTSNPWTFHAGVWWVQTESGEWQWYEEDARVWRRYKDGTPTSPSAPDQTPSRTINPALVKPPVSLAETVASHVDEIERLTALHERGALTDEEFQAAKARVLNP